MDHKKSIKQRNNEKLYQKSKLQTELVLLRLPKGGRDCLDEIAGHFGVARPALFDLYLLPLMQVAANNQEALFELARVEGCSAPRLLERLILRALFDAQHSAMQDESTGVAHQFDALFDEPYGTYPEDECLGGS